MIIINFVSITKPTRYFHKMQKIKDGFKGEKAIVIPRHIVKQLAHNPYSTQLYLTNIGFYPNARNHYRRREQGAQEYILICCVKGGGWIECLGQRYEITENNYFIIPANTPHTYSANDDDPWTIYWMHFNGSIANTYYSPKSQPAIFLSANNSKTIRAIELFEEIYSTLQNSFSPENLQYVSSCLHHFLGILRFNKHRQPINRHQSSIVDKTIEIMKKNIDLPLDSQKLASTIGYSYSHLSTLFSKSFGCSPCNYLLRLKIQQACHYLDFSDMKINEIALKVGIQDPYYFSRLFRKTTGLSPRAYRQQING